MAVIRLEIKSRQALAGGRAFGEVGRYVQLDGTAHFAVDPAHSLNRLVTDIDLAARGDARGDDGLVHCSADFRILMPEDPRCGSQRLLFDVPNRGNRPGLGAFNRVKRPIDPGAATDPGDGFLMRRGYTVVWCGWQHDVPATEGLMRIQVPPALRDGRPVSGRLLVSFQPTEPGRVQLLSDRGHRPYPCVDLDDPEALLLVRDGEGAAPRAIPRHDWSFARLDGERVVADPNHVHLAAGFEPCKLYHVVYRTEGTPVIGLGLLAARDLVAFLRHAPAQDGNPCAGNVEHAYAFGASQSGRYLRQFLYLGLNEDEAERQVFDGILVHIAGGKRGGDFNQRFGQPSASTNTDSFPFNEEASTDPVTGRRDGLLERLAARRMAPKIFYSNSSTEYWRGDASLIHTDAAGGRDVAPIATSRFYHFAGTQHTAASLPLTDTNPTDGTRGQQSLGTVDYNPLLRALLVRLDRWVSSGEEPPPSRYPRLGDGTAVKAETLRPVFTAIPGVGFPPRPPEIVRLDFGPDAAHGIATTLPPAEGAPYPHLVPAVDADGNEVSGIRLPDLSVPLATHTGWNLRHPHCGAPDRLMSLSGSTIPFPATREARLQAGDPRRAIAERYPDRAAFVDQVRQEATRLVDAGYLLAEDIELVVDQAARRFELSAAAPQVAAAQ